MAPIVELRIDTRDLEEGIRRFDRGVEIVSANAAIRIQQGITSIMLGAYYNAANQAGDGFHPIYRRHLEIGVRSLQPEVYATGATITARYYDISSLGDYNDLMEGFHYHALLAIDSKDDFKVNYADRLELPYVGQSLYNDERPERRLAFWQAIVDGETYTAKIGGGIDPRTGTETPSFFAQIPTTGMYEETLNARVHYWGNRYPEWLILEYGTEYYPSVPATHVRYFMEQAVYEYMNEVYEQVVNEMVDVFESDAGSTTQPSVRGFKTGAGGRPQAYDSRGRFTSRK